MNRLSANHYAMIVHEERLARARTSGQGTDLRPLREGLSALWNKLVVGGRTRTRVRRSPLTARPSARSAQ
jgi:hypothetical protein